VASTRRAYSVGPVASALSKGSDGRRRCWWGASTPAQSAKRRAVPAAHDDLLETYHDEEWGRPVRDDRGLYERMVLEGFQSGLSWLTILRKRENFRAAFSNFDIETVAGFGEREVKRLLGDAGIIRHRGKIESAINNAHAAAEMHANGESLAELVWSYAPGGRRRAPRRPEDIPAVTPESTALAKELKRRGFRFVGPTTAYATMQACGLVNDHLAGCFARAQVEGERRS
jgi:DNA-3-methyladenine glycosylase I